MMETTEATRYGLTTWPRRGRPYITGQGGGLGVARTNLLAHRPASTAVRVLPLIAATLLLASLAPLADASGGACNPPCGWIDPILELRFPEKPLCDAPLGGRPDPATCIPVPEPGGSVVMEGTLVWWWDVSRDGTYPMDPNQDIQITFAPTPSDPDWIEVAVEPAMLSLSNADLADPANLRQVEEENTAVPVFWFWYERPITVTLTRTGDPTAAELRTIEERGGYMPYFLKARSTESGDRFRQAFGVEEFRFAPPGGADDRDTPAAPLAVVAALLSVAALTLRSGGPPRRGPTTP